MRTLFDTLDQLDRASITAQRKLTIPFERYSQALVLPGGGCATRPTKTRHAL